MRADKLTEYLARISVAVLAVCTTVTVAIVWMMAEFPHALDGTETVEPGKIPNYFRNVFELLFFISGSALFVLSFIGIIIAVWQTKEAEKARLAGVYAQLETRWSSNEMIRSRVAFRELLAGHNAYVAEQDLRGEGRTAISEYFHTQLTKLSVENYEKYASVMIAVDYLEFIGMIEEKSYLDIADIAPLLGEFCIYAHDVLSAHLDALRTEHQRQAERSDHPGAPKPYAWFSALAQKFATRFKVTRPPE
jgi:hypothetical protein